MAKKGKDKALFEGPMYTQPGDNLGGGEVDSGHSPAAPDPMGWVKVGGSKKGKK